MHTLNTIPPEVLTSILSHISLQELFCFRRVSTRFKEVITLLFTQQKSVKLFSCGDEIEVYCRELCFLNLQDDQHLVLADDALILTQFNYETAHFLATHFPNITNLTVYLNVKTPFETLPFLATKLANKITTLIITGYVRVEDMEGTVSRLKQTLAQLKTLQQFHLLTKLHPRESEYHYGYHPFEETSPNERNLRQFDLPKEFYDKVLLSLKDDVKVLKLDYFVHQQILESKVNLLHLKKLRISVLTSPNLSFITSVFSSLVAFDIEFFNWPTLSEVLFPLTSLPSLQSLKLSFVMFRNAKTSPKTVQLPKIECLELCDVGCPCQYWDCKADLRGDDAFCRVLALVFPNLLSLSVKCTNRESRMMVKEVADLQQYWPKLQQYQRKEKLYWAELLGSRAWWRKEGDNEGVSIMGFLES